MRSANTLATLVDDVGGARQAARLLRVHRTTVYRWLRGATPVPTAAYRALYAASQYGRGDRLAWSLEGRRLAAELQAAQAREIEQLRQQLERLVRLADFGAANAPLWRMVRA